VELSVFALNYFAMLVRRDLALGGYGMLVLCLDIADVSWHGEATRVFGVDWAVGPF
jgi:hypothetical protein